jgi:hypothetical protein
LPGSNPALSVIAELWERLALDVVSEAVFKLDVSVCQRPIFNSLPTNRPHPDENPKDQNSLGLSVLSTDPLPLHSGPVSAVGGL